LVLAKIILLFSPNTPRNTRLQSTAISHKRSIYSLYLVSKEDQAVPPHNFVSSLALSLSYLYAVGKGFAMLGGVDFLVSSLSCSKKTEENNFKGFDTNFRPKSIS
jgi:hypothetical protein